MVCNKVTVASVNCQGLANSQKRRDVFNYLRDKAFSIYLLQDTHFDPKLEHCIRAEWGYKCYFASHSSNSRGVAILFNNNFEFQLKKVYKDTEGNFIFASIRMMEKDFLIVSLYGPNRDNPEFYVGLEERVNEVGFENVIMGGDWNLVLNFVLDYFNYKHYNNVKAKEQVHNLITNLDLVDIWREINPELRRFTWRRNRPFQQSRLDFFLISDFLSGLVSDSDILPGYRTDHSLITVTFEVGREIKRSSLWKFNSSLLKDINYTNEIKNVITAVAEEYAATPYSRDDINKVPKIDLQLVISDQLFLDTLLMKIRAKTISYATMKKRTNKQREKELENSILYFENKGILTDQEKTDFESDKHELISIREKRMQGVLLRSRARWIAEGEKITKYFCGLEKRNFISKQVMKLTLNDGTVLTETDEIVQEVNSFYKNLYEKKEVENCEISDLINHIPKLSDEDRTLLEGDISLEEAGFALKTMSNNKSPGSDGFTAEFFKCFWLHLGPFVMRSLNDGFRKRELSSTQKEAVIICIPKGDKPRDLIKNWRPISLLNVVYKIGSACIANRLKCVLPSLICEDQTGFIPNRYLGDNVRLIYDMIDYLNRSKLPGLLLCLDFEKAFDCVNWCFMFKVLHAFGFGPDFCGWIQTFYKDIKSTVSVNGKLSEWFLVERGCRQGDPISPYLFVICVEVLAIMIRQNEKIKGILVHGTETKITQYADDTELMLEGDRTSFEEAIHTVQCFSKRSGLYLNAGKTSAIWLGSKRNSPVKHMPHLHMDWNPERFKILGIWFTNDLNECAMKNFEERFIEIKAMYKAWLKRQITPLGRVAVLKSLILSKIIHLWILLPNPPENVINDLQKSVFQFVWNKNNDRISRKNSTRNIVHGGIGIPDVRQQINALKITWIRKLKANNHKWVNLLHNVYPKISLLEKLGPNFPENGNINKFWWDVFKAYKELGSKVQISKSEELTLEPLFYNKNIKIANRTIFYGNWIEKGVYTIGSLLDENGNFLSYHSFKDKYAIATNILTYMGCVQAVKKYANSIGLQLIGGIQFNENKLIKIISSVSKGARVYYDILLKNEYEPNCCSKWAQRLSNEVNWWFTFKKIQKIKDIKLRWFQLRIVHRILATNVMLQHMGVEVSSNCTFCNSERDSIPHIFWKCTYVQAFWENFQNALVEKCVVFSSLHLNENIVLFGGDSHFRSDDTFDLILLLAKFYIYRCKMNKDIPLFKPYIHYLKSRFETEKYVSCINMLNVNFNLNWHAYKPLLE